MKTDRELASGKKDGQYYWCLHCERAYKKEELRTVVTGDGSMLEMCHYTDCDGDAFLDAWDWEKIREGNPEYPQVPEIGKHYPMYS